MGSRTAMAAPSPTTTTTVFRTAATSVPTGRKPSTTTATRMAARILGPSWSAWVRKTARFCLAENINFHTRAGGKSQLTTNGNMMVALVARVLAGHVEVSKVRIEVRGKEASREVTQERGEVVLSALVKHGIDPSRLRVIGLGPGPSRVDFVIESRSRGCGRAPRSSCSSRPRRARWALVWPGCASCGTAYEDGGRRFAVGRGPPVQSSPRPASRRSLPPSPHPLLSVTRFVS